MAEFEFHDKFDNQESLFCCLISRLDFDGAKIWGTDEDNTYNGHFHCENIPLKMQRAVVVAQLVERSLPMPEVRGSNPVIGKNILNIYLLSTVYWKDENKEKEAGNGPFF